MGAIRITDLMDLAARLLHPAVQALLLGMLSTALVLWRKPRWALWPALVGLGWIWIASMPALALHLRDGLVTPAPAVRDHADAIVVLGGGKLPVADWSQSRTRAGMGLLLWKAGFAPRVLLSGSDQATELARGITLAGVPATDVLVEATSTNTHENARNASAMLRARGLGEVILVTSAIHMRRAAGCFRQQGIAVTPMPAEDAHALLGEAPAWLPRRDALTLTARCLREYVALWVYGWRGWL